MLAGLCMMGAAEDEMGGVCEALQGHGLSGVQSRTQLRSAAPERVHTRVHGPGRGSPARTHACMPDLEGASSVCVRHRQLTEWPEELV